MMFRLKPLYTIKIQRNISGHHNNGRRQRYANNPYGLPSVYVLIHNDIKIYI